MTSSIGSSAVEAVLKWRSSFFIARFFKEATIRLMGLIILPVTLFLGLAWLVITFAVASLGWRLLSSLPYGRVFGAMAFCSICSLSWYLPNREGLNQKRELEHLKVDCGWTVYRKAENVNGLYIDSPDSRNDNNYRASQLLRHYRTLEYPEWNDKVVQLTHAAGQVTPLKSYISSQTQRYSLVDKHSIVGSFRRDEVLLFDHLTNQVLARDVEYWPNELSKLNTVMDYAMYHLRVHPDICQSTIYPDLIERVVQVAIPEKLDK